jgi:hypothetical protein
MRDRQLFVSRFSSARLRLASVWIVLASGCAGQTPDGWNTSDQEGDRDALVTLVQQAEEAALSRAGRESLHAGFKGTSYVNYDNVSGGHITFTVNAPAAGSYTARLRYANGTAQNRTMRVEVNGATAQAALSFPATGAWTSWAEQTLNVQLAAGANTVRAVATTSNGGPKIAYNHFAGRMGESLPNSRRMVQRVRPAGTNYFIAWETLTHADTGENGL